jgi:phosphate transport system substrate-binding protein
MTRCLSVLVLWAVAALTACGGGGTPTTSPAGGAPPALRTGNPSSTVTVRETGSTLLLPFLQQLVAPLRQEYPSIVLDPAGGGSGRGISDALSGAVDMGGSDAYLSNAQVQQNLDVLDLPVVVSGQAVTYNLPGIAGLRLTGAILARIYEGEITAWNDPAIASLNPGVRALPGTRIVPLRRVEASGDTFIFTQLLSATSTAWQSGPAYGARIAWPQVPGELAATGNRGMVQTCSTTPGCVAYVGISFERSAIDAGLGEALLQNRAGRFLAPTRETLAAALDAAAPSLPGDLRRPLIYEEGAGSYPITNFEYLMVHATQPDPNRALAIRTLLRWLIDPAGGASPPHLSAVGFVALPPAVISKVEAAIARIAG